MDTRGFPSPLLCSQPRKGHKHQYIVQSIATVHQLEFGDKVEVFDLQSWPQVLSGNQSEHLYEELIVAQDTCLKKHDKIGDAMQPSNKLWCTFTARNTISYRQTFTLSVSVVTLERPKCIHQRAKVMSEWVWVQEVIFTYMWNFQWHVWVCFQ